MNQEVSPRPAGKLRRLESAIFSFRGIMIVTVAIPLGLLVLAVVFYAGMRGWEQHRVSSFCHDVKAGMPVDRVWPIAQRHGIRREFLLDGQASQQERGAGSIVVVVAWAMNQVSCDIEHDGARVTSARMWLDGEWEKP